MPRVISFLMLVAILLLIGAVFFQVMAPFILPLFLAAVLVVVFKPVHLWFRSKLPGRPRWAALATTGVVLLTVLAPTSWLGWRAYQESGRVVSYTNDLLNPDKRAEILTPLLNEWDRIVRGSQATLGGGAGGQENIDDEAQAELDRRQREDMRKRIDALTKEWAAIAQNWVVNSVPTALKVLAGSAIMILAVYYFLADGPQFIHTVMLLSPLEPEYEQELLNRFANVSRAVVSATLISALVQGVLAGIGFYLALGTDAPIFLLMAATMVLAVVPFVGAAGVWIPTCVWIYLYQPTLVDGQQVIGDTRSAIILATYCAAIVSTIDNLIKPLVLHGQSNLHPLVALLSVLGGIAALGPVGLIVGPMIVAFVQAVLVMVNKELARMGHESQGLSPALALHAPLMEPSAWNAASLAEAAGGPGGSGPAAATPPSATTSAGVPASPRATPPAPSPAAPSQPRSAGKRRRR